MQVKRDETRSVWHPIETSPRDETAFIAYSRRARAYGPNNGMVIAFWSDADFLEALTGEKLDEALYTHWSPLPHKPHRRGKQLFSAAPSSPGTAARHILRGTVSY